MKHLPGSDRAQKSPQKLRFQMQGSAGQSFRSLFTTCAITEMQHERNEREAVRPGPRQCRDNLRPYTVGAYNGHPHTTASWRRRVPEVTESPHTLGLKDEKTRGTIMVMDTHLSEKMKFIVMRRNTARLR